MDIKVLGPGCAKCEKLYTETQKAILEAGVEANLTKVQRIDEIASFGIMITPALVIGEQVKFSGKVPSASEIARLIRDEMDETE
ncbi:MAG: thioredoxin family protein [bacterium]